MRGSAVREREVTFKRAGAAILFCLTICSGTSAFAQCRPPRYRVGTRLANSPSVFAENISVPIETLSVDGVLCLAKDIRERSLNRTHIMVNVFTSREASLCLLKTTEITRSEMDAYAQMHARYVFDAQKHEEYIEIMPFGVTDGFGAGSYSTRIDLPAAAVPHCRLEISGR